MEVGFDNYCLVDSSPKTVLPPPRQNSKLSDRKPKGKPKHRNHTPIFNDHFIGISISKFSTTSCRNLRSHRTSGEEDNEPLKTRLLQKTEAVVGREKIDFSGGISQSSLGIINSLCGMDEDSKNQTEFYSRDLKTLPKSVAATANETDTGQEKDRDASLQKSLSLLLTLSRLPGKSGSDVSRSSSPKSRVGKMLLPFVKSKSHRSPLSSFNESNILEKPPTNLVVQNSAAHLRGILRLENKHGEPFFEFSVKSTEDVYVGKAREVESDGTRVYTLHPRRKTNAGGWGFRDGYRDSSMVGQMRVSCRVCSELNGDGVLNDSLVMEFVLYDVVHSQKCTPSGDSASCSPDIGRGHSHSPWDSNKILFNGQFDGSDSQPVADAELGSKIEIGAVVTQVPLGKKGMRCEGKVMDGMHLPKMHAVIPAGNHTWPVTECGGPLPLLERWRLGGGCDCGGWDMACPLVVFTNQKNHTIDGCQPLTDSRNVTQLFVQGKKESMAAFGMRAMEDGKYYAVNFHARLSSLQALFISMAVLHSAETSTALVHDSLRLFAEEKYRSRTDATAAEEVKSKVDDGKEEVVLPYFVLNPPFSPVARV